MIIPDTHKEARMLRVNLDDIGLDDAFMNRIEIGDVSDLTASIIRDGQQVPIILRRAQNFDSARFQIISGFRRFDAIRKLGESSVQALVHENLSDAQAHRISLLENIERESLSAFEQVRAAGKMKNDGLNIEEIGEAFRVNKRTVQRYLKLSKCSPEVREALHSGLLSISAAYEVERGNTPLSLALENKLSVRQIKAMNRAQKSGKRREDNGTKFRRFKNRNFNLTLRYKAGLTNVDEAMNIVEEAWHLLQSEKDDHSTP